MQESIDEKTDQWVIIEQMGHRKLAGRYSFENGLHRVDVPTESGYITKWLGTSAIYEMHAVDEAAARFAARNFEPNPIGVWELQREMRRLQAPAEAEDTIEAYDDWKDEY